MLVATPGQTASYSTLHNSSSDGGGGGGGNNNTTVATSTTKKSSTATGASKPVNNNNNNNHATSTVTTKSSLNCNSNSTTHNYHSNTKNDNIVLNKQLNNQNKCTATTSSREIITSSKKAATTHSLKTENSTNTTSTTNTKQQSFIQTLKESVQKALISTTGSSKNTNSIAAKHSTDNKLQNNCNNSITSANNVTSSSSSTSHNANKISETTSSNAASNSMTALRRKYFSRLLSRLHTVAPTIIHRYPEERQHASSTDSLHKEMCHFKPIRVVPKTPFKSGSKSRGNSLRFPKASLATKKIEFVLKSNCDVNNRKRKQKNRTKNDKSIVTADEDDENEQENKEFHGIYKPKPSLTCLTTSFNTPNHTSAFVSLIADVKNFGDMSDNSIKELFTRQKEKPLENQILEETIKATPRTRGHRQQLTKTASKVISKQNAKTNKTPKGVTKAKSLRNVGRTKSKATKLQSCVSMPAFATNKTKAVATTSKSTRKRKAAQNDNHDLAGGIGQPRIVPAFFTSPLPTKSASNKSITLTARKSSRLSAKEMSTPANKLARYTTNRKATQAATLKHSHEKHKNPETVVVSFSPPMTRSRLRHLTEQGKIVETAAAVTKRRKI